jgi:hypothetical protein
LIGGAIQNNFANINIINSRFNSNVAQSGYGGAIQSLGGTLTVTGCLFTNGAAVSGAYLSLSQSTVTITNSSFVNGVASSSGGCVYLTGASVTITNSSFSGCTAISS